MSHAVSLGGMQEIIDQLTRGTASWTLEVNAHEGQADSLNNSSSASPARGSWKSFATEAAAPANSITNDHWAPKIGELLAQQELLRLIASVLAPRDLRSNMSQAVVRLVPRATAMSVRDPHEGLHLLLLMRSYGLSASVAHAAYRMSAIIVVWANMRACVRACV